MFTRNDPGNIYKRLARNWLFLFAFLQWMDCSYLQSASPTVLHYLHRSYEGHNNSIYKATYSNEIKQNQRWRSNQNSGRGKSRNAVFTNQSTYIPTMDRSWKLHTFYLSTQRKHNEHHTNKRPEPEGKNRTKKYLRYKLTRYKVSIIYQHKILSIQMDTKETSLCRVRTVTDKCTST